MYIVIRIYTNRHIYIYIYIFICISLHIYIYIFIYMSYICICMITSGKWKTHWYCPASGLVPSDSVWETLRLHLIVSNHKFRGLGLPEATSEVIEATCDNGKFKNLGSEATWNYVSGYWGYLWRWQIRILVSDVTWGYLGGYWSFLWYLEILNSRSNY